MVKSMRTYWMALLPTALCALGSCASAPVSAQRETLLRSNHDYDAALLDADAAALGRLYADDFRYLGPNGVVRDKPAQIAALTSGQVDLIEGQSSEVDVRLYESTAVITGRFAGRVRVSGREFSFTERYSTVWVNGQAGWRLVLEHGSVIENP